MIEYEGIPKTLKLIMVFIDRVGFPVLAFILMFVVAWFGSQEMTKAITKNTEALLTFSTGNLKFQELVCKNQDEIKFDLKMMLINKAQASQK